MLRNRVIKWRKLIVMVIVGFLALNFLLPFFHSSPKGIPTKMENIGSRMIVRQEIIDKKLVIKVLTNVGQVVGLEGDVQKTYSYSDSWFKSHKKIFDWIGGCTYTMDADARFKMGINLQDITNEDITISGKNLLIFLPKPVLVSLELPYDKIKVKDEVGFFRIPLAEKEKQFIYGEVYKSIQSEILNNKDISSKASKGVQEAMRGFLDKLPNVDKVIFVSKP